jgi:arabinofuranosyltransferase
LWASLFIYRSSVVAFDGERYFALFDDAMISMRYAWNFSHGLGLVWNPGEYVEGYTNPLWTLVMSLPTFLFDKSGAVLAIQVLGVVLMLANAYLVMLIADHLFSGRSGNTAASFGLLAFCARCRTTRCLLDLDGDGDRLAGGPLSLSVLSALRYVRDRKPARGLLLSASLGLAFLTRPDAGGLRRPHLRLRVFRRTAERSPPSHLLALVGPLALIVAGQEAFRWVYYGELMPNTYTLKVTGWPLIERIENGMGFVRPFLAEVWVLLILVGTALLFDFRQGKLLLAGVFAMALVYQVWTGGDAWDRWRIFSPAMPLMLVLAAREIFRVVAAVSDTAGFRGSSSATP